MFADADFHRLYALVSGDQTVDDTGPVDCGVRCGKHCCKPSQTTKYLLPGEREFLERSCAGQKTLPFGFRSFGVFDSIDEPSHRACACEPLRALRPFNCRIFPYGADVQGTRVVGLVKGTHAYLEPCWISIPAEPWKTEAIAAWQMVLDDSDNRALFARLWTLWDWTHKVDRGEEAGSMLMALAGLDGADDEELWRRAACFFKRDKQRAQQVDTSEL